MEDELLPVSLAAKCLPPTYYIYSVLKNIEGASITGFCSGC